MLSTLLAIGGIAASAINDREVLPAANTPTPASWDDNAITLAWLGHATVLINFYGLRVPTDPAFFPRIGVDTWVTSIGPLRLVSCALLPSQLPDIDLVLVSHAHFDHLDTPSLSALPGRPAALMAPSTSDLMPRKRYSSVRELRWGESARINTARGDVEVRAIEVKHWGARLRRIPIAATTDTSSSAQATASVSRRHRPHTSVCVVSAPWPIRRGDHADRRVQSLHR